MKATYLVPIVSRLTKSGPALLWVALLALASTVVNARDAYVWDNEFMLPSQFPSADGWTIAVADRVGKVEVTQYGLDYQVSGGALINGGTRCLRLIGNTSASGLSMNNFLTYALSEPIADSGPVYFAMTVEAETEGITTDPHELFLRLAGWNVYVAMKSLGDIIEIPGASTAYTFDAGTTYRIVGRLDVTAGNITAMKVWVNPAQGDEGTPTVENNALSVPLTNITQLELRSQKAVSLVDDLEFADSWDAVVPPLPADPGDLIVTVPADNDALTPGYQVNGGTLFIEVGGSDYVADTPLAPGTEVTFRMIPDTANDYVLTGWRGYKGPRDSNQPFQDFKDATILGAPVSVEEVVVIPIYAPLNIRPIFELFLTGDIRLALSTNTLGSRYRLRKSGSTANQLRTLWGPGEQLTIRAIPSGAGCYVFTQWEGDLAPLNPVTSDTTPLLTAGAGVLAGPVVDVEARTDFAVLESMTLGTTDVIGANIDDPLILNGIEWEANNLGAEGSVPLCVMQAVVTEKAPLGLAGVVDFETLVADSGTLFFDPSPGADNPVPGTFVLARDVDGNYDAANSFLGNTRKMILQIGLGSITVETGEFWYTEVGELGTEAGPGGPADIYDNNYYYDGGLWGPFKLGGNPSGRVPVSGDMILSNTTSYQWAFDAADKVVMAGAAYLSRDNFQHYNPDDLFTLWAKATYDDGTTSATLRSNKLEQTAGLDDHFFGFEAPAGKYITRLHIWCSGRTARAFTNVDDLVVVLEGAFTHTVSASSINPTYGTVSGGGTVADGSTVTLTATPGTAPFLGWAYACEPCAIVSSDLSYDVNVHASKTLVGVFDPHPAFGFATGVLPGAGTLDLSIDTFPEFNYFIESSGNLINWTDAATLTGDGTTQVHQEPYDGTPTFLRVDYCAQ